MAIQYGVTPKGYIRGRKAARLLGVTLRTVLKWVRNGRLKGKYRMMTSDGPITIVKESSLAGARKVKCLYCGRVFTAKRPMIAKFCSREHIGMYHYHGPPKKPGKSKKKGT